MSKKEKQVDKMAEEYVQNYKMKYGVVNAEVERAIFLSHKAFLMDMKKVQSVRVTVGDLLQLTVEYDLYDGKHGEPCIDILKATFDNGRVLSAENLDIMNHELASAVEVHLGL